MGEAANVPEDLAFDYRWAKDNADRRKFHGSEIVKLIERRLPLWNTPTHPKSCR